MKIENLEEAAGLIGDLKEVEEMIERLDDEVFSVILTDGRQKRTEDVVSDTRCIILEIHPDDDPDGRVENRLGAMFVENLKKVLNKEIDKIKEKLSEL